MNTQKRSLRSSVWLAGMAAALLTATSGASTRKSETTVAGVNPVESSQYVGSDTCKSCHEESYKSFETTPHWKTMIGRHEGGAQGCESCHGPGKAHVEGGGDKSKIFTFAGATPKAASQRCLSCHEYGEEHSNFLRSAHSANDVSCTDCHSPHHAKESRSLLVQKQPDLCFRCHTETRQDFERPFRHRVEQGLIQCSDCHNEHGGFLTKQLRSTAAQDQVCFKCHADKAGPFAFEHQPVKTEGCVACHQPHGSTNPRLLKRAQVNLLCLECHTLTQDVGAPAIPSFHNQSQKYSACTMCHPTIHGSNFDAFFMK